MVQYKNYKIDGIFIGGVISASFIMIINLLSSADWFGYLFLIPIPIIMLGHLPKKIPKEKHQKCECCGYEGVEGQNLAICDQCKELYCDQCLPKGIEGHPCLEMQEYKGMIEF